MAQLSSEELYRFCGGYIEAPGERLWWQNAGNGLLPLADAVHVKAAQLLADGKALEDSDYSKVFSAPRWHESVEGHEEKFRALVMGMKQGGWNGPRVKVAINERGQIILTDGLHRSSTAFVLGIKVPCEIVYRHERWIACKYALLRLNDGLPKLYQAINHPDLASWASWRRDTQDRAAKIVEWLKANRPAAKSGIDLACNAGVLTMGVARGGYEMLGLDTNPSAIEAARLLATMDGFTRAAFNPCDQVPVLQAADFAVCLSLLNHHWTDGRNEDGQEIFKRLVAAAPVVFLDCPAQGDPVGGHTLFVDPFHVFKWCKESGAPGEGAIIEPGAELMRPLLVWTR